MEETKKKRKIPWLLLGVAAVVLFGIFLAGRTSGGALPPEADRALAVSRLWQAAKEHWCYFDQVEGDWDAAYERAMEQVMSAKDRRGYVRALEEFRALLPDGHGDGMIFSTGVGDMATFPFQVSYMGDAFVVTASISEEIAPGDVLTAIEGEDPLAWLEREVGPVVSRRTPLARENALASRFQTYFPKGTKLRCTFENAAGQTYQLTVKSVGRRGSANLLTLTSGGAEERLLDHPAFQVTRLEGDVFWVKNLSMLDTSCWDVFCGEVLPLLEGARGVILDLRDNEGGNSALGSLMLWVLSGREPVQSSLETQYALRLSADTTYAGLFTGPSKDILGLDFQDLLGEVGADVQALLDRGQTMAQGGFLVTEEQYAAILDLLGEPNLLEMETGEAFPLPEKALDLPVIVLIGPRAGSAVDTTAQTAKDMGIPTLGTRTSGATGDIFLVDLGSGISTAFSSHYIYNRSTGTTVNNHGIEAEIYQDYDLSDLRRGVDTQLCRALDLF